MPEPGQPSPGGGVVPPTPPLETSSSRASFTSCPPEERRERHARRTARADRTPSQQAADASFTLPEAVGDRRAINSIRALQQPTPEPETDRGARSARSDLVFRRQPYDEQESEKSDHVEDSRSGLAELPSAEGSSPEAQSESEVRLAQSMASAMLDGQTTRETAEEAPKYLVYPPMTRGRVCAFTISSY